MKIGAWAILTAIAFPMFGLAGARILDHSERIVKIETEQKTQIELLKEIRCDIKDIKGEQCR